MLARIKTTLGIAHTALDQELENLIADAKSELIRLGVPESVVEDPDNHDVQSAVLTYVCWMRNQGTPEGEGYLRAWAYKSDCIRKTVWE